ncbi:MAG TPA: hypothetical protein VGK73_24980 [Polyangiaceae bacterium]
MHGEVTIVSALEPSWKQAVAPAAYRLRFPRSWRPDPVGNRYLSAIDRDTVAWLNEYGIGGSEREREKLRKFDCGMYGGYSLPTAPFATALLVTQYISLWLFWDDVEVEDDESFGIEAVVAALAGDLAAKPANRYVEAWADLGERLRRLGSSEWVARVAVTMREWLENAKIETAMARRFREEGRVPGFEELFECRTVSIGMYPTFHLIELTEGIELPDAFHEHASVRELKRIASRLVGLGNDLGGVAKDIKNRWLNLAIVLAETAGLRLEAAFGKLVQIHNAEVAAFDWLVASLPSFGPEVDPFVAGWVQAVRYNVHGFALWESLAERYQEYKALVGNTLLVAELVDAGETPVTRFAAASAGEP